MRIVDTKKEVIKLDGKNFQVKSIRSGNFYFGIQVILKHVLVIPYLGIAIELKDSRTYLKHYKDLSRTSFNRNWYLADKPIENVYDRVTIINNSSLVKASKPIITYLENITKKLNHGK